MAKYKYICIKHLDHLSSKVDFSEYPFEISAYIENNEGIISIVCDTKYVAWYNQRDFMLAFIKEDL